MRHFLMAGIAAAAGGMLAAGASAQTADDAVRAKLQGCRAETSDIQRLACFDRAFATAGGAGAGRVEAPVAPAPPAAAGSAPSPALPSKLDLTIPDGQTGWLVRRAQAPLDGSPIVAAILQAKQARIARHVGSRLPQQAALVVICRNHQTDMYVGYSDIVDGMGPVPVRYQVGNNPPVDGEWVKSQDFMSYGLWHTAKTVPFIRSLATAATFSIRADPGPMGVSEATFDLAGMTEAIAPVGQACGW